jgi:hypothetical protein
MAGQPETANLLLIAKTISGGRCAVKKPDAVPDGGGQ